jgi:hypothetical protein
VEVYFVLILCVLVFRISCGIYVLVCVLESVLVLRGFDVWTHDLDRSGVCKMTYKTCNKAYIGQTSWNLTIRCCEHIRYIKNNQPQSAYAQHILRNILEYGTLTETITLLKPDTVLIPYEQLFIQAYHQTGNVVPEQTSNETNPLF